MAKAEWETLRSLHGRKRLEQIWMYYKLPIFLVLLAIYGVCWFGYRQAARKNEVLYLAMVNVSAGEDLTDQLTTGFLDQQGLTEKDDVYLYNGLLLSEDADQQYVYASRMKILGAVAAQQLDVVLMDAEARDAFLQEGYLADLRTIDPALAVAGCVRRPHDPGGGLSRPGVPGGDRPGAPPRPGRGLYTVPADMR